MVSDHRCNYLICGWLFKGGGGRTAGTGDSEQLQPPWLHLEQLCLPLKHIFSVKLLCLSPLFFGLQEIIQVAYQVARPVSNMQVEAITIAVAITIAQLNEALDDDQ